VFRYSLWLHIGARSTIRSSVSPTYPLCYEDLVEPTLFKVEAFKPKLCPRQDIWPCPDWAAATGRPAAEEPPPLDFGSLKARAKQLGFVYRRDQ